MCALRRGHGGAEHAETEGTEDREALGRMLSRLSARSIYERFHAG